MALLSWSNQYLIGDDLIDAEHRELFRLINDFHDLWQQAHDRQGIARVFNQLVAYAEMHFRHEEGIMREAGYPRIDEHRDIHDALIVKIFALQESLEAKSLQLEAETMKFVRSWLVDHILDNDYRFRDFLARQGAAKSAPNTPLN